MPALGEKPGVMAAYQSAQMNGVSGGWLSENL